MSVRDWLVKRETILLKEPLIKRLGSKRIFGRGSSVTESLAYDLGAGLADLLTELKAENVEKSCFWIDWAKRWLRITEWSYRELGKTIHGAPIDFSPEQKMLEDIRGAVKAGNWTLAKELHEKLFVGLDEKLMAI